MITIKHNLNSKKFKWLWAKYVNGVNLKYHCTNSLKGNYSKKFSKLNESFSDLGEIIFDEFSDFKAIYICGVSAVGYPQKTNYPLNLHLVLIPSPGATVNYKFLNWSFEINNARISEIISENELAQEYKVLEPAFTTCRIFRWACSEGLELFQ
jgi:hypothetical protein